MTFASPAEEVDFTLLEDCRDRGLLPNWIGGRAASSASTETRDVYCPYNGSVLGQVPLSTPADVDAAVRSAANAFQDWSRTNIRQRAQVMYRFKALLEQNLDGLAHTVSLENGKTVGESKAEILKGIEVLEFACSLPDLVTGRILAVGDGIDCSVSREPLGVVASITPFNFPVMVPLWTIPIAIALGNTMIHKPSEQVPLAPLRLAELLAEAGLPDGVFSIVNGRKETVEALCDHPGVRALSLVGSTAVARSVYSYGCGRGKRVLALGGAKNHLIVMPDADPETTARAVVDAATGCAGQRCMAASVMVAVGETDHIIDSMADYAASLEMPRDMGAIINRQSLNRIRGYVDVAASTEATALVDGRTPAMPDPLDDGYWFGPTILDQVDPGSPAAREEIFGPVLSIVRVATLDDALEIENASPYGNAASIFTTSGAAANAVAQGASAGMIGVNIGIPVPREPFGFGGWNQSKFGVTDITGESSVGFWTQDKKVTVRW